MAVAPVIATGEDRNLALFTNRSTGWVKLHPSSRRVRIETATTSGRTASRYPGCTRHRDG